MTISIADCTASRGLFGRALDLALTRQAQAL